MIQIPSAWKARFGGSLLLRPFRNRGGSTTHHGEKTLTAHEVGKLAGSGVAMLTAKGAFQQVFGFASTIVVTRMLLPDQLGVFAIASTISGSLWMLAGGQGMAGALIRNAEAPKRADLHTYVALQLGIMTLLAAVAALATLPFGLIGRVTLVMVAAAPITAFKGAGVVTLERELKYRQLAKAETAEMFAYYSWTVATVAIGWGVWGLASATVVRAIVGASCIVALTPGGVIWPRFERARARSLLGIGVRVQAVEVIGAVRDQIVTLGTAAIGGLSVVAYWNVLLRVLQAPGMLLSALVRVAFPAMSRLRSSGSDPAEFVPRLLPAATVATGLLMVPVAGTAPVLVPLLLGSQWAPAADALPLACLALVIHQPLTIVGQSYLWAIGDAKSPLSAISADSIVFVVLGLALVPFLGVLGLAIGLLASAAASSVMLARAIARHANLKITPLIRAPILAWIVATAAACGVAEIPGPPVARVLLSTVVSVAVYLGLLSVFRRELVTELAGAANPLVRRYVLWRRPVPAPTA